MKLAIIVIDMLKDFVRGSMKCDTAQRIIDPLQRLLDGARAAGIPVIFANDVRILKVDHDPSVWGKRVMIVATAARLIDELEPGPEDYHVPKHHHSAFRGTNLHPLLEKLGVNTVVLCGLHTNLCVTGTAADAFHHGYSVIVPPDGVEAFTEEEHLAGLDYLEQQYGAKLISVDELIEDMDDVESCESSDRLQRAVRLP